MTEIHNRQIGTDDKAYSVTGPLEDGKFVVWSHDRAEEIARVTRWDDAVDLAHEEAGS